MWLAVETTTIYGILVGSTAITSLLLVARYERRGLRELVGQLTLRTESLEGEVHRCERRAAWSDYKFTSALQVIRQQGVAIPPAFFQDLPVEGEAWPRLHRGESDA